MAYVESRTGRKNAGEWDIFVDERTGPVQDIGTLTHDRDISK
jgi:hypothetical protein